MITNVKHNETHQRAMQRLGVLTRLKISCSAEWNGIQISMTSKTSNRAGMERSVPDFLMILAKRTDLDTGSQSDEFVICPQCYGNQDSNLACNTTELVLCKVIEEVKSVCCECGLTEKARLTDLDGLKGELTEYHIINAECDHITQCAVAVALQDMLDRYGFGWRVEVQYEYARFYFSGELVTKIPFTAELCDWIMQFDEKEKVNPITLFIGSDPDWVSDENLFIGLGYHE